MVLSDEEEDSNVSSVKAKPTLKRKPQTSKTKPLKKVKYENITSERQHKKHKNELYKPPTVEELNELKETQNLYNNNLFRLQIEELVKEIKIKVKHRKIFETWYTSFQDSLNELPEYSITLSDIRPRKLKRPTEQRLFINEIANDEIKCDQDFILKFVKPSSVDLFGLDSVNALPGPNLNVKIALQMPRSCFNVKDYLNNRYFVKRYFYLAYIRHHLKDQTINCSCHNNNKLLPILQFHLHKKISVEIYATPPENYFKLSRFAPDMNNVKSPVFNSEVDPSVSTVFYNASLAFDATLVLNYDFIKKQFLEMPNVQEAVKLIRIWLNQRYLNVGLNSFKDDLVIHFMSFIIMKKKINKHMSSYQVIRNFWNFISETDLNENPISLADDVKSEVLETFKTNFDLVFLDKSGYFNLAAFLNVDLYKKIKTECSLAFKLLDNGGLDSFYSLFITKLQPELQYDLILTVKSDSNFSSIKTKSSVEDQTKYVGLEELSTVRYIQDVLHKGLNKRVTLVVPLSEDNSEKITFGLSLDPIHAFDILELGPALNDPEEKGFKDFWGELATDRRFKDGSVCVAVYFETKTIKERREIISKIIHWVVGKKLKLMYSLHFNEFESLLVNKKLVAPYPTGTNEESSLKAIAASDDLGKILRELKMPLAITGVGGISDFFSMTDVFPPDSSNYKNEGKGTVPLENNLVFADQEVKFCPRYIKPIESVLHLEHSSKWPNDLSTLRHMKTAFYLQLSKELSKRRIVTSVKPENIDVLFQGYVFRYTIYIPREVGLLKKESTNDGMTTYKDTSQSLKMELKFDVTPKLVGALKGLQSQFPSFGPATALAKRWLRSHLIDSHHVSDDVINLLNASQFLDQSTFKAASTPQLGFLRFMKFLAEFQQEMQVVIVNFNDEISKDKIAEIDSKLLQNRAGYPSLFIATPYDNCESLFTKAGPSLEVLRRMKQLATETLTYFGNIVKGESLVSVKNFFIPNLEGFNVVININPPLNPVRHEQVISDDNERQITLKEFNSSKSTKIPLTDFNPVQCYLKDLRDSYGEFAEFFHDFYGGVVIGVLWKPKALESKEFKVIFFSVTC